MDYYELSLKRRQQIEEGLLELLRSKPYEKVSVTDIAAHMGMSRKSFYKYFSGKDDCLVSLFDRVIQEAALHVTTRSPDSLDTLATWREYLRFWQTQRTLLEVVEARQLERIFLQRYIYYTKTEEQYVHTLRGFVSFGNDETVLRFYLTGIFAVLLDWCHQDFAPGLEEMSQKMAKIIPFYAKA